MPNKKRETVIRETTCPICEKKSKYKFPKTKKIAWFQVKCGHCGIGYACVNGELDDAE